ncbi:MAG: PepSY domain-containing protein [Variovorax sp.]|nr:MAG: PepSY domain-containing protein [Variovorax sp.]
MKKLFTLTVASAAFVLAAPAFADSDKGLPADQIIAAIQAAVASQPGQVKDVEVKDRRNNPSIVEVEIVAADGKKHEVKVDPATRQVVR